MDDEERPLIDIVREHIPLEQGLRLAANVIIAQSRLPSESIFH